MVPAIPGRRQTGAIRRIRRAHFIRQRLQESVMTILVAMRAENFASYLESSIASYADDNIASGRWPKGGAIECSRAEFERLLPQGLATPNNYLFEIQATDDGPTIGCLWFAVEEREYRRLGHATRAFQALESFVDALGLSSIGLHVFGHNPGAQALYRQLGYHVTGINMLKQVG
jgi:GNAT superfamily N-acetyltransferase